MNFQHGKIPTGIMTLIILVSAICLFMLTPIALADNSARSQSSVPYHISGYVFVDGIPMDNVLIHTDYGGGNNTTTGPDGAGRHGYYTLSTIASQGPTKVIAVYGGNESSNDANFSTLALIDHPNTDTGYGTLNLFIETNPAVAAPMTQPEVHMLDRVAGVVNNFISQITNWVKINSGVSPYNNATSGAVFSRAVMYDASEISYTDLALVDAKDTRKEMYHVRSDEHGFYNFTTVKNTYNINSGDYDSSYRLKADVYANVSGKISRVGEGISPAFSLMPGQTARATAVIFPSPFSIEVQGPAFVGMNGQDHMTYSAYMTDAWGRPVPDGYMVQFALSNNNVGMGELAVNGSSTPSGLFVTVPTAGGYARAEYGWVTRPGINEVKAAYEQNMNVNSSADVELR
ncbi:MAG TPA: hypothetical protein VGK13_02590 [Methanocellaceae archaeon]